MRKSATYVAAKRQRARAAGLCITCCNRTPNPGYFVCQMCKEQAHARRSRRRALERERAEWRGVVAAHETAGDKARVNRLFDNAAQHYQEALSTGTSTPNDRQRLVQKLSHVSFLSNEPAVAVPWRARVVDSYSGDPISDTEKAGKAVGMLTQITRQMWIDSKTQESLALREEAVRIAERYGTGQLRKRATLHLVSCLMLIGRFDDASQRLGALGSIEDTEQLDIQRSYYRRKGIIAAFRGSAIGAYQAFESAVQCAKNSDDIYSLPAVLENYAVAANALGDIERARALFEETLLVVRRNHMGWIIPQTCMGYANILRRMGRYTSAHKFLLEALASEAHAPILEERFASAGIPIALYLKDEATLAKCTRPSAIDLAFQSGEPARIGPVAAAFAQLYAMRKQIQRAQALLHRALESVTYVDESIDLPIVVAQYGMRADIPSARLLLEKRMQLPSANVARSILLLFDAIVAKRTKKLGASSLAVQAIESLDRLQWYAYGDLARSMISLPATMRPMHEQPLSGALPTLTEREREVVELVLQGHTNRAIAQQLTIREHTVEKHMSSIMSRLGIRSRHQLIGAMTEP